MVIADGTDADIVPINKVVSFMAKVDPGNCPGPEITYTWTFGDGTAAGTGQFPKHPYTKAGTFTATAIARCGNCPATKSASASVKVIKVEFQMADGTPISSTLRIGIPTASFPRVVQLKAVVTPADEVNNVIITSSGDLTLSSQKTSGNAITFAVSGKTKSTARGTATITALHSTDFSVNQPVSVVVPDHIGTPHDVVGNGRVKRNDLCDSASSPACPDVPHDSGNVWLLTNYYRLITIKVLDQFGDPVGDLYEGSQISEDASGLPRTPINRMLASDSTYQDPAGFAARTVKLARTDPQAQAWPTKPPVDSGAVPTQTDTFTVVVDGFPLTPAVVRQRSLTQMPENDVIISWP